MNDGDMSNALELVRDNVLHLLRGFEHPPSSLRVEAGGVTFDAAWPQHSTTAVRALDEPAAEPADGLHELRAPSVGTFYRAPEPGASPFVEVGDVVAKGDQVAIVEVMKLMVPVEADVAGTIAEVLRSDGDPVEHDQPLFRIEPR